MRSIRLTCILFIGLSTCLFAQTNETETSTQQISLDACLREALENNFSIQIELTRPRAAQYDLSGSYGLYEPTMNLQGTRSSQTRAGSISGGVVSLGTDEDTENFRASLVGELPTGLTYDVGYDMTYRETLIGSSPAPDQYITGFRVGLEQPLLRDFWINDQRAQIEVRKGNLKISEYGVELQMMQVVRDVQKAYYDLIAAVDEVKVREKALELAQRLFEENRKRVAAGVLAPLDEKQAESEVAVARANLILARRNVVFSENVLKNLITDEYSKWHTVRLEPVEKLLALSETFNRTESWYGALENRPDFNQARVQVENQGVVVKLNQNQLYPSFNLIGGFGRSGFDPMNFDNSLESIDNNDNPEFYYGARLSIPLGFRRERNRLRSSREQLKELQLQMGLLHQNIIVEVDNAITQAEANYEQIPARREARLYAEAALDAEQKKLENGKSTSFFVLQLQRDLTTARAAEIRALSEYNKALADFYYSEGSILERNKINVNFK